MSLVVQTSAGLTNADAYVSLADAGTYWSNRNVASWAAASDAQREAAIRKATVYIDTVARYKGVQLVDGQSTEFPRSSLVDWNGFAVSGVPQRVKDACCELAYKALSEELYTDLERGGMITNESVGPISTSYAYNAPAGKVFRSAIQLLKPYMRDPGDAYAPYVGGVAGLTSTTMETPDQLEPLFEVGMHANSDE